MSRHLPTPELVIEWSPTGVLVYDAGAKSLTHYGSMREASVSVGTNRNVRVAIARRSSFIKAVRVPDAAKLDVLQMLRITAANHLPLPAAETAFDVRLTGDVNMEGRLAIIAAVRADDLRALQADLKTTGWKAIDVLPSAFGSMLVAHKCGLQNCTVVERTKEGWTLDVIADGELRYSRTIPLNIHEDAVEDEVARTYAAAEVPCGPIVTAGGLSLLFAEMRSDSSSLELLATPQAETLEIDIELQEEAVARITRSRNNRLRLAGTLAICAIALAAYCVQDRASAQAQVNKTKQGWQKNDKLANSSKVNQESRNSAANAVAADLGLAFQPAQRISDLLSLTGNLAPAGVWLTGVDVQRGKPVLIRGTATTSEAVATYVKALSSNDRFRDVRLVFANDGTIEQRPVVQFSVQALAVGNLPLADATVQGKAK